MALTMIRWGRCFSPGWLLFLLLLACRSPEPPVVAPSPVSTAVVIPSPTPTVLPTKQVPDPTVSRGVIFGQVLGHDGTAAAEVTVLFCQDFTLYGGCGDKHYTTMTDAAGNYVMTDIEPGHYALVVHFDQENERRVQYASDEALRVKLFQIGRNQQKEIDLLRLFANDLVAIAPMGEVVSPTRMPDDEEVTIEVLLQWDVVSETAVYEVYLAPEKGEAIWVSEQVTDTQKTADLPRLNCAYHWYVSAFDPAHVKIAETRHLTFTVTGADASCDMTLLTPQAGAVLSSTKEIILDWEAHETADSYRVWLVDEDNAQRLPVLNFEKVSRSRYEFPEGLAVSHYIWAVAAYDETGRMIAESGIVRFEVVP